MKNLDHFATMVHGLSMHLDVRESMLTENAAHTVSAPRSSVYSANGMPMHWDGRRVLRHWHSYNRCSHWHLSLGPPGQESLRGSKGSAVGVEASCMHMVAVAVVVIEVVAIDGRERARGVCTVAPHGSTGGTADPYEHGCRAD
eukprot:CAMPEP_0115827918 /NCGR_PEP_ID=MMETSP0287-20121206/302_1 /TAXON_ID=412157 /ORGANISM="Chrysochromulina rotalis, Strain UIO044" /LENGTH=142 /DNA_ID=CAMNT_0003281111 /DNA_START=118 /DNA_END=547 /DNA_ORIENTATION=-